MFHADREKAEAEYCSAWETFSESTLPAAGGRIIRLLGVVRRTRALFAVRCLEIELHGQNEVLAACHDEKTSVAVRVARRMTQHELARARADYHALLQPGERRTWELA